VLSPRVSSVGLIVRHGVAVRGFHRIHVAFGVRLLGNKAGASSEVAWVRSEKGEYKSWTM